ncbi:MAG: tyrosine-type recombinase/integrase [Alphaproteobacteria bacterium]
MNEEIERECAAWPADQAARWRAAFARPGGWSPRTRRGCARSWSRYLEHCRAEGLPERLSRAGVAGFARAASARGVKLNTFHTISRQLHAVARIVEPTSDMLAWLAAKNAALAKRERQVVRRKHGVLARAPSADRLYARALDRLAELNGALAAWDGAPSALDGHTRRRLRRYRSTLVLALALACPERRGALAALAVDDCDLERGELRYRASTTKTGEANTQPLPGELVAALAVWLAWRDALGIRHRGLWFRVQSGRLGAPIGYDVVYRDIRSATRELAGVALWPHLTRDLAADLARRAAPASSALASSVLNHRDPRTSERYGSRARQTERLVRAQRALADALAARTRRRRGASAARGGGSAHGNRDR